MLGTLSRGAWLAVLVVGALWAILNRQWKLMGIGAAILVIAGVLVITQQSHKPDQERLLYKLQQTDSSYRYTNGTQGTAWILIQKTRSRATAIVMMCMIVFIINALSIIQRGPLKNLSVRIIPFCTSGLVQAY